MESPEATYEGISRSTPESNRISSTSNSSKALKPALSYGIFEIKGDDLRICLG